MGKLSITAASDFDDEAAESAASTLRGAMKGFGTDEHDIKKVIVGHSHAQRMAIKQAYYTKFERSLIDDLKSELRGDLEKLCVGFWHEPGQHDAESIHDAMGRLNTDEGTLTEIICTRIDAETLNRIMGGDDEDDIKEKFVALLSSRSWVHIAAMDVLFLELSNKYTLTGAIDEAFGNDSDSGKALRTVVQFASQPYDYWAKRLHGALEGMGTDDDKLRRVLISRAEIDLKDIGVVFGQRYGDGRTLTKWIEEEVDGDYGKLCLAVCGL